MAKKSYGCTVFGLIVLGAGGWYAYTAIMGPLERFEADLKSLPGKNTADAERLLGKPDEQLSYRDPRAAARIQDLVDLYPGIKPTRVDYRALIYVRYKRCGILYVTQAGKVSSIEFGQID